VVDVDSTDEYARLATEETRFQFDEFRRSDALAIGTRIVELAREYPDPVAIEIAVNGLVVFRHFTDGALADSELWLERKRRVVDLMAMSSLRFMYWLDSKGETLESRKLDPAEYAPGGGGFPIVLRNAGMIGSICVSGMDDHLDDHNLVIDALAERLGS
jgi:uncharacterized protein (UPF0303 family)